MLELSVYATTGRRHTGGQAGHTEWASSPRRKPRFCAGSPETHNPDPCSGTSKLPFCCCCCCSKGGKKLDGWMSETPPKVASGNGIRMAAGPSTHASPPVHPTIYPFILDTFYEPSRGPVLGNWGERALPSGSPKLSEGSRQVIHKLLQKRIFIYETYYMPPWTSTGPLHGLPATWALWEDLCLRLQPRPLPGVPGPAHTSPWLSRGPLRLSRPKLDLVFP